MPCYRIHRLKEVPREGFRWAAHTGGLAVVKPKDYEPGEEIDADNPYQTWKLLMERSTPLHPGDLLETVAALEESSQTGSGELKIVKYIGFEPAQWFVPESKASANPETAAPTASLPTQTSQSI
jgi:hypothetical protein